MKDIIVYVVKTRENNLMLATQLTIASFFFFDEILNLLIMIKRIGIYMREQEK